MDYSGRLKKKPIEMKVVHLERVKMILKHKLILRTNGGSRCSGVIFMNSKGGVWGWPVEGLGCPADSWRAGG